MQDHRHDPQEASAIPKHSQQPENEKLRGERAGFQAVIGEILSEEDHQAAQRKLGAAQPRIAKGLNRISAIGAILGPVSATLGAIPSAPPTEAITVAVPFRNTGHEPATDAFVINGTDSIGIDATYDEIHAKERAFEDYCFSISGLTDDAYAVSIVIFPGGSAANDYNGSITLRSDLIDWDVVYGKKYVFLHACVVYQTFGQVRHTSVCYYAQAGKTIGSLPFCDKGNRAD